jgi:hypothetical protein
MMADRYSRRQASVPVFLAEPDAGVLAVLLDEDHAGLIKGALIAAILAR